MVASFPGFRSLIESSPDSVSLINTKGEVLYRSASTARVFGYPPEEVVGQNWLDLIHPEDRGAANAALREMFPVSSGQFQWEARLRHKDGHYVWVENTIANLLAESGVHAIVLYQHDITLRRAAEQERQEHVEELARCNSRLEEFAYTAAHDLREPLRAISVYTELLIQETQQDSRQMMAKFVIDGTTRMSALINDLLSFASTGRHEPPQSVDMESVLAQATENLAASVQASDTTITIDRLPVVRGNEIQLVRLVQNLLSNALKYRRDTPLHIRVSSQRRGLEWIIQIQDNGLGIAVQDHVRVFTPFMRLGGREIPGTGLGLAVCKKIVEGLGGTIWADSEVGAGSTFSFTIMAAEKSLSLSTSA
jgi:PAS domain S-box-containing protein